MRSVSGTTSTSSRGNAKARGSRQNRSCVRFTVEGLDLSSHTLRKVKFLSKNSILTNPQHFHEFFTQIFFDNFSREIKVEFLDKKWRFRTVCCCLFLNSPYWTFQERSLVAKTVTDVQRLHWMTKEGLIISHNLLLTLMLLKPIISFCKNARLLWNNLGKYGKIPGVPTSFGQEFDKKIVKVCLYSRKAMQIFLQIDEFFDK